MGTVWECLFYRREKVNLYFLKVTCFCLLLDILHECCVVLNRMSTSSSASHPEVHPSTGFTPDVKKWRKDRDGIVPIKKGEGLEEFSAAEQKAIADVIQVVEAIPQKEKPSQPVVLGRPVVPDIPVMFDRPVDSNGGEDTNWLEGVANFFRNLGMKLGDLAIGAAIGLFRAGAIGLPALKRFLSGIGGAGWSGLRNLGSAGLHLADKLRQLSNRLSSENDAINYNENASTVLPPELEDSHMAFAGAYMGVAVGTAFQWVLHNRAKILIGLVVFGSLVLMAAGIYLYNRSYDQYAEAEKDMKLGVVREDTREAREKMEAMRGEEPAPTVKYVALSPPNLIGEWAPPPAQAPAPA